MAQDGKPDVLGFSLSELESFCAALGEKPYRSRQLWQWLWRKGADSFESMTSLGKDLRQRMQESAVIGWPSVAAIQESADGTVKFLLALADGEQIETVLIPEKDHFTQCLSTQVGCSMGCTFCATGSMGLTRNMAPGEICGQILVARRWLQKRHASGNETRLLRNLVFMGMGEPLQNLSNLLHSLETITNAEGLDFSPRRVTVSTVGLPDKLPALGESGLVSLAVSLHAPSQQLREQIMPLAARACSLDRLMESLRAYPLKPRQRLTFEYLMLGGVNDSTACARDLVRLLSKVKAKVNLISYNPPGDVAAPYAKPNTEQVEAFQDVLRAKNLTATLRKSKGADIAAACGQLKADPGAKT